LPRIFVTADEFLCSSIHCAQKVAYSLNASFRPPVIKNDFAYNPITGESISLTSSPNSAENVASDANLRLLIVRSRMELQN
jgi:hypothetical protein